MVGSAFDRPIEENGTVLTNGVRDKPGNSARRHVVSGLIGPDRMVTTFLEVVPGLVPVAGHNIDLISKSQRDEVRTSVTAIASSLIGMIIVNMDAHDAPVFLAATGQPSANKVIGHLYSAFLIGGSGP